MKNFVLNELDLKLGHKQEMTFTRDDFYLIRGEIEESDDLIEYQDLELTEIKDKLEHAETDAEDLKQILSDIIEEFDDFRKAYKGKKIELGFETAIEDARKLINNLDVKAV